MNLIARIVVTMKHGKMAVIIEENEKINFIRMN